MAKNTAESSKNVLNITKTLSERQQMRVVSVFYHGMFNIYPLECPGTVTYKSDIKDDTTFNSNLRNFMSDEDFVCSSILFKEQKYMLGDIVIVGIQDCDNIDAGVIKAILVKANKLHFVIQRYQSERMFYQYFICEKSTSDVYEFVDATKLIDFKPLILRGTSQRFVFTLHQHLSHDYQ